MFKLNTLKIFAILMLLPITNCYAVKFTLQPIIGLDIGGRTLQFENGYGKHHFASHYYHASPYVGFQLLENFGFQLGCETSDKKSLVKIYNANDQVLGMSSVTRPLRFSSQAKISGEFLGIYVNTDSFWEHLTPVKLSLLAGVASLKLKMSHAEFSGNGLAAIPAGGAYITENISTSKKVCPKIALAANLLVPKINGLEFKIVYGWEKTSNLKEQQQTTVITNPAFANKLMTIKLKNSHYMTIGLNYKF